LYEKAQIRGEKRTKNRSQTTDQKHSRTPKNGTEQREFDKKEQQKKKKNDKEKRKIKKRLHAILQPLYISHHQLDLLIGCHR